MKLLSRGAPGDENRSDHESSNEGENKFCVCVIPFGRHQAATDTKNPGVTLTPGLGLFSSVVKRRHRRKSRGRATQATAGFRRRQPYPNILSAPIPSRVRLEGSG